MRKVLFLFVICILCLSLGSCQKSALNTARYTTTPTTAVSISPNPADGSDTIGIDPTNSIVTDSQSHNATNTPHASQPAVTIIAADESGNNEGETLIETSKVAEEGTFSETVSTDTSNSSPQVNDATDRYVSLKELRANAPQHWTGNYQAYGRTILVDAPVILPENDNASILDLRYIQFDEEKAQSQLVSLLTNNHNELQISCISDGFNIDYAPKTGSKRNGPSSGDIPNGTIAMVKPDKIPDGNDYPPEAPYSFLQSLLSHIGLNVAEIELTGQVATTGFYPMKDNGAAVYDASDLYYYVDRSAPVSGYEEGYYQLTAHQALDGIQVFDNVYWLISNPDDPADAYPYIRLNILNEEDFSLSARLVEVTGIRVLDAPLLSYDEIQKILEQYIYYGIIRRIDRLELGYMLYYAEDTKAGASVEMSPLVAVPTWQVIGEIAYDAASDYPLNSEVAILMADAGISSSGTRELRIHAQTGAVYDRYSSDPIRSIPDILTWEDTEY